MAKTGRTKKMADMINKLDWRIVIHEAEEGGYWGEVPAMPGCVSEGETLDECRANVMEAARGCLETYLKMAMERLAAGRAHRDIERNLQRLRNREADEIGGGVSGGRKDN